MKGDKYKTRAQLLTEIEQMRGRIAELEASGGKGKHVEEALDDREKQLSLIFDSVDDVIFTLSVEPDDCYRFIRVNRRFLEATGLSESQIIGKRIQAVIPEPAHALVLGKYKETIQSGQFVRWEETSVYPAGKKIGEVTVAPIYDASGHCIQLIGTVHDVTESRLIEKELRQSNEMYSILVEKGNDGIIVLQDGLLKFANSKATEITGFSGEEVLGQPFIDFVAPQYRELVMERYKRRSAGEEVPNGYEIEILNKNGSGTLVEVNASLIEYDGRPAVLSMIRDITERKKAEEALRDREHYYRSLIHQMHEDIVVINHEYVITDINNTFMVTSGMPREQVIGKHCYEITHGYDVPCSQVGEQCLLHEVFKDGQARNCQHTHVKADGSRVIVDVLLSPLKDVEGNITHVVEAMRDITEHKQAEEEIARFKAISDLAAYGITMLDAEKIITYVNKTCAELHGYTREELIGKHCTILVPESKAEAVDKLFEKSEKTGGFANEEMVHKRKDGTTFPALMTGVTVKDSRGMPLYTSVIVMDITEQKKAQESLIVADRLASMGELVSGIAHELNNPLTGVIGFSELLMSRRNTPEDIKEDLAIINKEATRASQVARNLLTFARRHPEEKQLTDVNKIIRGVLELRAYEQKVHNIEVKPQLAADLPAVLASDFQLQQVFINIVINAEHFMLEAHGRGILDIATERRGDMVRIAFADDGPGITPEHLGHIFDPFYTTKEVGKGTGLGLSICYGIIAEHGGTIYAESEPGKGATFIIELPVHGDG